VKLNEAATAKGFALPSASKEAIRVILSEPGMSKMLSEKIVKAFDDIISKGLVALGEKGNSRTNDTTDAVKAFNDEIGKIMTERHVDYGTAAIIVAKEQPQMFSEYQASAYAGND
jgi:hypothetical protein